MTDPIKGVGEGSSVAMGVKVCVGASVEVGKGSDWEGVGGGIWVGVGVAVHPINKKTRTKQGRVRIKRRRNIEGVIDRRMFVFFFSQNKFIFDRSQVIRV